MSQISTITLIDGATGPTTGGGFAVRAGDSENRSVIFQITGGGAAWDVDIEARCPGVAEWSKVANLTQAGNAVVALSVPAEVRAVVNSTTTAISVYAQT